MDTYTEAHIRERLEAIREREPHTIRACVAQEALEYSADCISNFFKDLFAHGCRSGMVGSLIYYSDTYAFFNEYYAEIEELRRAYEKRAGMALNLQDGDLKNSLAWFGFEETAWHMAKELHIIHEFKLIPLINTDAKVTMVHFPSFQAD